ncbi:MAG: hypothetical protein KBC91_00695, partial [Candidatus Omnitrophica bacterium]|nr:hypothetical protein [Candidatus Omnitrophota bacterium]
PVEEAPLTVPRLLSAGFVFSLAVTGRIHFVLFLPVFLGLLLDVKKPWISLSRGIVFSAAALALPLAWYSFTYFASMRSEHVLTNIFCQAGARKVGDQSYLLSLEYYRRIFDIFTQTMLTPLAFPGFLIGLAMLPKAGKRVGAVLLGGLLLGGATLILSPQKIMAHDFYLAGVFPFIILTAALGISQVAAALPMLHRPGMAAVFMGLFLMASARYFTHPLFTVPQEIFKVQRAAEALQKIARPEDEIIVAGVSTASMAYYADRPAWVMQFQDIGGHLAYYLRDSRFTQRTLSEIRAEEASMQNAVSWLEYFKAQGAKFFAASNRAEADAHPDLMAHLRGHYRLVSEPQALYYLFDLSAEPLAGGLS